MHGFMRRPDSVAGIDLPIAIGGDGHDLRCGRFDLAPTRGAAHDRVSRFRRFRRPEAAWRASQPQFKPRRSAPARPLSSAFWPPADENIMSLLRAVIKDVAGSSDTASYSWKDRGVAPAGYIKGMALVYARVYCRLKLADPVVMEMAKPVTGNTAHDALAWYNSEFTAAHMHNHTSANRLRHLFVLLIGEGMRESGGEYCDGQGGNTTADTAEAGLFQTSYNARHASSFMPLIFQRYKAFPFGFLDVFKEGVTCTAAQLRNYGTGDGAEFQRLSKACPAFAAEFAAVGFRNVRKHWGPLNCKTAEVRRECDAMLNQVQAVVETFLTQSDTLGVLGAYSQLMF